MQTQPQTPVPARTCGAKLHVGYSAGPLNVAAESDTNVVRLFRSAEHFRNPNQKAFHFKGVGTSPFERIRGGVLGHGLFEQVKDGYLAVVNEYRPGDEVTIAGFSRGAFAARCLGHRRSPGSAVGDLWK